MPIHNSWGRIRRSRCGNVILVFALFVVALFGFAALSIDVGNVYDKQRKAQIATDATAYAAVALLTNSAINPAAIVAEAQNIAAANGVSTGEIAAANSYGGAVQLGYWNTNTLTFISPPPGGFPTNTVRVPARRTVPMFFGSVVGTYQMNPQV